MVFLHSHLSCLSCLSLLFLLDLLDLCIFFLSLRFRSSTHIYSVDTSRQPDDHGVLSLKIRGFACISFEILALNRMQFCISCLPISILLSRYGEETVLEAAFIDRDLSSYLYYSTFIDLYNRSKKLY